MNQKDVLQGLQEWYRSQCNDAWEHTHGVKIDTLDNPGWTLSVDLKETELEDKPFSRISRGAIAGDLTQDEDWLVCEVKDKTFTGAGGPGTLAEMIAVFLAWAKPAD
jgi:Immunity protein 53